MKNNPIFIITILLFSFLSCQQKNEMKNEDSRYQEKKDCICQEDLKSNDGVLAYHPVWVKKKDGDYLQFQCASMMRIYMSDENGNEFEKNKVDCISSEKLELKLNKDFVYYIPTTDENDTPPSESSRQIFFDRLKKQKDRFYQLSLSDQRQITNINDFYYESD